ncbi:dolichol-phosphate mannose synthase subunit 2 [Teleopsis dalmanni]|uniref:dolichol-phosphate mannose synthase subunit 2-like n=1 Tax=Teleopsis dalmanni TaxID=139649 RepID=UPI0018CFD9AF|nr:dolichol-phosphate mannose synthase subunit 2-like [Teleopsis dalmanni]XP_037928804.1 dolichol-phosphate mannose synthase subunit 2-like [Teleopsis dalmanni]XP_037938807.1 dolichol-phosphate mannose synthase subunit 2 [Teleopsis dalmanni]XP_037938809.1 dolichol-phosphate mannose synthase subunit 2 [Teleopsis dalmanni]
MASNAHVGKIVLAISVSVFLYYFFWVSILPFMLIDEENLLHSFFPPLEYAFIVPAVFGVIFLGGIAIFTLYHMWTYVKSKTI